MNMESHETPLGKSSARTSKTPLSHSAVPLIKESVKGLTDAIETRLLHVYQCPSGHGLATFGSIAVRVHA